MNNKKPFKRLMATVLSVIMVLVLTPVLVSEATETLPIGASVKIIAFEELAPEIAAQRVPTGTEESALILPETLTVTVQSDSAPGEPEHDSGEADNLSPVALEFTVTWKSVPEYDGDTTGEYIYAPTLPEGYILAEGVESPRITVMVEGLMFSAMAVVTADYSWYDANTAAHQFTINSSAQLKGLADIVNGNHGAAFDFTGREISLTADLDLTGYDNWTPIGANYNIFAGTFAGNRHTISGLTIDEAMQNGMGLFGLVLGSVSDLYLSNVNITGKENVGGIAGEVWGSLSHCAVIGGTVEGNLYIGGIAGKVSGSLTSCFTTCDIRGIDLANYSAGGVAGRVEYGGTLTACYATGSVSSFEGAGGVAGSVNPGHLQSCYATGEVTGTIGVGGIVGVLNNSATMLEKCTALNIRVTGAANASMYGGPSTGRVAGRVSGDPQVINDIAFSGMIVANGGGSNLNGADKSSIEIKAADFFNTNGFSVPLWQSETGMLPILTGFPEGLQSGELPAHIGSPTPTQPQTLIAEPNNGSVKLNWAVPGSVGASSIIRYEVRKNTDGWISAGMTTTYTFIGLTNGTTYTFEVRAVNSYGNGAVASIQRIPVNPGDMAAIPGDRNVILNWATPPSLIDKVQLYQVRYNGGTWVEADDDYTHTFFGLVNGMSYTFEMQAAGVDGTFVGILFSDSVVAMPVGKPLAPTNLTAVSGNQQIVLSWDAPYNNGGSPILRYEVSNDGGVSWVSDGAATTYTFTGLINATAYSLQVRAVNAFGTGSSETISATPRQPPGITSMSSQSFTYGSGGTFTVSASGTPPFTYALSGQPEGVSINGLTGVVTVDKTVCAVSHTFTVTATNGAPPDAAQTFTLNITTRTPQLSDVQYTAPSDRTYNGTGAGIGPVTDKNAIGLTCTVYYHGINGTIYPRSETPPKNAGKYEVIAGIVANTNINAVELYLGSYSILPKSITVTPTAGQNKVYGQSDPPLQYNLSDALFTGDGLNGVLARNAGENVGTYNIAMGTLTAGGNYTLALSGTVIFTINPKNSAAFTIAGISLQTYTGSAVTPEPEVKDGSRVLTKSVDYTYGYNNNTNAGTSAVVSITGIGNYLGSTGSATFTINPKADAAFTIAGISPQTYNGSAVTPEPEVKDGSRVLTKNVDYTYGYSNNTNAGTSAVVSITGFGNYLGSTGSAIFTINPKADAAFTIAGISTQTYTGGAVTPEPEVKDGSTVLTENVDFTYGYSNNTNAGTSAVVSITGIGNYLGSTGSATFTINKATSSLTLMADPATTQMRPDNVRLWAALPADATGTLTFRAGASTIGELITLPGRTIVFKPTTENNNYSFTVEYSGDSNYEGVTTAALMYSFTKSDQAALNAMDGTITFGDTLDLSTLVSGGSGTGAYSFVVTDGPANLNGTILTLTGADEVNVLVTKAADNDFNTKSASFKVTVNPRVIAFTVAPVEMQTYTGSVITPTPEVKDGELVLTESVHFTYGYSNNIEAGTSAAVNITGIGGYAGSNGSMAFTIGGAAPDIMTPPSASDTVYTGTALSEIMLAGGEANVSGYFEWVNPSATAVSGQNTFEARFVPDDAVLYTQVEGISITFTAINPSGSVGGASFSLSMPIYRADVKSENGTEIMLPVTVNKVSGTASIDLGSLISILGGNVITIPTIPGVDTYSVGIPVLELSSAGEQGTLTCNNNTGSITVPSNMLTGASGINGSKAEITIGQGDKSTLPDNVKSAIGDRPLVHLMLSINGRQTNWSNPAAPVTVSIPYTPTAAELANPESIVIWYIDGSGNIVTIPNGHYNPATGIVNFTTTHFSDYAVAYNKVSFNDAAANAWYSKAVSFIAARKITSGTGIGNYSPDAKLTRGEYIVLMMRAYGIAPVTNPTDNFTDAVSTYYTGYLAAAKRLGITAGVGNNMYAPGKQITRQEMFTLLYNALKVIGQLPQGNSGKIVSDFTDASQIDEWAREAMTSFVVTGTVGGDAGKLTPNRTTTRAEMAQVLYNLLGK